MHPLEEKCEMLQKTFKRTGQFAIAIPVQVNASGQCCSKLGHRPAACSHVDAQQLLDWFYREVLALCPMEDKNRPTPRLMGRTNGEIFRRKNDGIVWPSLLECPPW